MSLRYSFRATLILLNVSSPSRPHGLEVLESSVSKFSARFPESGLCFLETNFLSSLYNLLTWSYNFKTVILSLSLNSSNFSFILASDIRSGFSSFSSAVGASLYFFNCREASLSFSNLAISTNVGDLELLELDASKLIGSGFMESELRIAQVWRNDLRMLLLKLRFLLFKEQRATENLLFLLYFIAKGKEYSPYFSKRENQMLFIIIILFIFELLLYV